MATRSARKTAAHKAKQRRRAARRKGILKVRKPGARMSGRVKKAGT